jgi:shikimate kinase
MNLRPHRRPIALVGMPGAGKSAIGRALAERLVIPFVDSDEEVMRRTGRPIAEIFERSGEAAFRANERAAIRDLLGRAPLVLATGGGAMAEPSTRQLLQDRACTIWLDVSPADLARRLAGTTGRPLLDSGNLLGRLECLLEERRRYYEMADRRIAADAPPEAVVAALLRTLR